ncbi:MAG: hypothetical protein QM778_04520 [Myxococcales bacterium]
MSESPPSSAAPGLHRARFWGAAIAVSLAAAAGALPALADVVNTSLDGTGLHHARAMQVATRDLALVFGALTASLARARGGVLTLGLTLSVVQGCDAGLAGTTGMRLFAGALAALTLVASLLLWRKP